ncbi:MAG: hypothetical protein EU540_08630 [Promethearchaeota archaeon]|nr:MAG: hypothetical protein EU540_08630 [Candidatus Lokiarchaeota archaeon]
MELEKLIGQQVKIRGIAKDAKGGAVLITTDGNVIYIKEFESWPSELLDKQVSVSGILNKEKFIPDPVVDENGAISCGAFGEQLVLKKADIIIDK